MKRSALVGMLCAVLAAGCTEELSTPADCPALCPGTSLVVQDTTVDAVVGLDSTYTGYVGATEVVNLLISDGINAGEARAFASFPKRGDSVLVDGTSQFLTADSATLSLNLVARDSVVTGLRVIAYRIPSHIDTLATVADLDALMTPDNLIDSSFVSDTVRRGLIRVLLAPDKIPLLAGFPDDSGRTGIGYKIRANEPTGIRVTAISAASGAPGLTIFGKVAVTDTAKQRQTIGVFADTGNYAIEPPPPANPDLLIIGGKFGTRSIIRFSVPRMLRDSASVLRATLELTPAVPIRGLRNNPGEIQVRGILADLGPKSPPQGGVSAIGFLKAGATEVQSIDVRSVVETWFGPGNVEPTAIFMGIAPEGASFARPEFFSSRSVAGAPRLRITYALPSRPGHP